MLQVPEGLVSLLKTSLYKGKKSLSTDIAFSRPDILVISFNRYQPNLEMQMQCGKVCENIQEHIIDTQQIDGNGRKQVYRGFAA